MSCWVLPVDSDCVLLLRGLAETTGFDPVMSCWALPVDSDVCVLGVLSSLYKYTHCLISSRAECRLIILIGNAKYNLFARHLEGGPGPGRENRT